jgi:hypothetical protein
MTYTTSAIGVAGLSSFGWGRRGFSSAGVFEALLDLFGWRCLLEGGRCVAVSLATLT